MLPAFDKLDPFLTLLKMTAKPVDSQRFWLKWLPAQGHIGFFRCIAAFAPVTGHAGSHQVFPGVPTALVARDNVVDSQDAPLTTAILAGVVVAAQNLSL